MVLNYAARQKLEKYTRQRHLAVLTLAGASVFVDLLDVWNRFLLRIRVALLDHQLDGPGRCLTG